VTEATNVHVSETGKTMPGRAEVSDHAVPTAATVQLASCLVSSNISMSGLWRSAHLCMGLTAAAGRSAAYQT